MVVLATKCYVDGEAQNRSMDSLRSMIQDDVGDLDVETEIGLREDDFPAVTIDGPDATAARNLLRTRWGEITPHFEEGETYVGTLESWDDSGLVLDSGTEIRIPTDELGLGPGSPDQLRTRFGLVQHVPLKFVYGNPSRLASETQDMLYEWTRGEGRVNVNSATRAEVRATVNRAGHAQDIVTVERLGLLEQSIVCKPNTDPPGLLASIGQYVPAELLCVVP
jgi:hypothetical protein